MNPIKRRPACRTTAFKFLPVLAGLLWPAIASAAPQTIAMTYQGRLTDAGDVVNDTVDLRFALYDAEVGGAIVGSALLHEDVPVVDGVFTVELDFGASAFKGDARWLEIGVRPGPDAGLDPYTTLSPRQPLTSAPTAWYSMRPWAPTAEGGYAISLPTNVGEINGVGIGTGSLTPAARLHVRTGGFFPPEAMRIEDGFARSQLRIATPESAGRAELQAWNGQTNAAGSLSLNVNGGNVGIGTDNPLAKLDVAGALYAEYMQIGFNIPTSSLFIDSQNVNNIQGDPLILQGFSQGPVQTGGDLSVAGHLDLGGDLSIGGSILGDVGIGTTSPASELHVNGTTTTNAIQIGSAFPASGVVIDQQNIDTIQGDPLRLQKQSLGPVQVGGDLEIDDRILISGPANTSVTSVGKLFVNTGHIVVSNNYGLVMANAAGTGIGAAVDSNPDETLGLWAKGAQRATVGESNGKGTFTTDILILRGGADIAEPFDVNSHEGAEGRQQGEGGRSKSSVQPGMVVSIDPANPGELRVSSNAYDARVAGIISGAGGVNPGLTLQQDGTRADGEHPVALTGRVYVYVDADANGAIQPGDMLTTSITPGHAMKATDRDRSFGAIIGKAMTGLESGRGLVLVLVNLQ